MKLSKEHIDQIRLHLVKCEDLDSFVSLLNKIQGWDMENPYYVHNPKPIRTGVIKFYMYDKPNHYTTFNIPKKSGGERQITAPKDYLKHAQYLIKLILESVFTPMSNATGFTAGRSVITNAAFHVNKKVVINVDLKDFFPSITFSRVNALLTEVKPFQLNKELARIIANLCCFEGVLPQGAPTSPLLSNAICMRLDRKLLSIAKTNGFQYSRYADDITFSTNNQAGKKLWLIEFKSLVEDIIESEGFKLNVKKERVQEYNVLHGDKLVRNRQEVTGIVVNEKLNVSRHYIKNLRALIHNWERAIEDLTYDKALIFMQLKFTDYYLREKGMQRYKGAIPPFENYVSGKLEYLGMVRGKDDPIYLALKFKFDRICKPNNITLEKVDEIMELWKEKGIKKALDSFYNRSNINTIKE